MELLTSYILLKRPSSVGTLKKPNLARKIVFYLPLCYKFFVFFVFLTFMGCCSHRSDVRNYSTDDFATIKPDHNKKLALHRFEQAACHLLYKIVPANKKLLCWKCFPLFLPWMLFGNDDDGLFGEGPHAYYSLKDEPSLRKAGNWWLRNPLHNFCFYVIGSADRINSEVDLLRITSDRISIGRYDPIAKTIFASEGSCFYLCLHGGKPFISLRICFNKQQSFDFYIGWRERGNFGIKLNPFCSKSRSNH